MKSEKIKIEDIEPAEYNPRKISKKEYKKFMGHDSCCDMEL